MPSTNPSSGIPIPLDPDPVRDGAKNIRDVVSYTPYILSAAQLFGAYVAAKPILFYGARITQTSNQFGQIYVAFPKALTWVQGAWITSLATAGASLTYDIDMTNPPGPNGMIFRVYNPITGTLLPNRPVDLSVLVIGQ